MAVSVPNALSLATIADGSAIVASDHRNNYAAAQVGVNGLIAMFAVAGTKGDLIVSEGGGSFDKLGVGSNGQVLTADSAQATGMKWASVSASSYRKTTVKAVNTTTSATDLLNAEITVAAGAMGSTGLLRLTAWGDWKNNSGGTSAPPRFQLVLGSTTIFDTGTSGTATNSSTRLGWRIVAEILNAGSASAQVASLMLLGSINVNGATSNAFTVGEGTYRSASGGTGADSLTGQAYGTASVATASSAALLLNVINGSANASYETALAGALVEII